MSKSICVIGAGLAGGIIASDLSKSHDNVILIELGGEKKPYEGVDENWNYDKPKASFTRGTGIGGTSNYWHGGLTVLDEIDVEGMSALFNEKNIPIKYSDLNAYYTKAIDLLKGDNSFSSDDIFSLPKKSSNDFVINNEYFKYKGLVYPSRPFSTSDSIQKAIKFNGLTLIQNFEVEKINFTTESRATSVEGYDHENGVSKKYFYSFRWRPGLAQDSIKIKS